MDEVLSFFTYICNQSTRWANCAELTGKAWYCPSKQALRLFSQNAAALLMTTAVTESVQRSVLSLSPVEIFSHWLMLRQLFAEVVSPWRPPPHQHCVQSADLMHWNAVSHRPCIGVQSNCLWALVACLVVSHYANNALLTDFSEAVAWGRGDVVEVSPWKQQHSQHASVYSFLLESRV